ncbi:TetR/AcrR family transcriptional regulator [Arthrobacter sp. StoSoilB20]|uniref:TetR/AcrR family transcriptional regulator n=1 Tax=Arthrobacter sp. StoSoilB20 TaxID=2830995 RepID=UPI001CC75F5A|nr:TetR/AcrR family transcriptional regulator [Arthrobacter sp. StoSoilB20]
MENVTLTAQARGPYAPGEAARLRILAEAKEAFGQRGYRGASLSEIAKAAGITQQGLLYHFGNKEKLLVAVLKDRDEEDLAGWPQKKLVGTEVLDAWDSVVERNVRFLGLVRLSHVLCAESTGDSHPARGFFLEHFDLGRTLLTAAFAEGVDAGELRPDIDYEALATQIIAMHEGLENQWLVDPEGVDILSLFKSYTRQVRTMISLTK